MFLLKVSIHSCMIILYIVEKKHFYRFSLQAFGTETIFKCHIKDCFKINGKQRIIMLEKSEHVKFRNYESKMKSLSITYTDFQSILVPESNGKQNPEVAYTSQNIFKIILLAFMVIN